MVQDSGNYSAMVTLLTTFVMGNISLSLWVEARPASMKPLPYIQSTMRRLPDFWVHGSGNANIVGRFALVVSPAFFYTCPRWVGQLHHASKSRKMLPMPLCINTPLFAMRQPEDHLRLTNPLRRLPLQSAPLRKRFLPPYPVRPRAQITNQRGHARRRQCQCGKATLVVK